jgi:uncharacterized protein
LTHSSLEANASHLRDKAVIHNLVVFARFLRSQGLGIAPPQIIRAVEALDLINVSKHDDVRNALRCTFVSGRAEWEIFERAFDLFFSSRHADGAKVTWESVPTAPVTSTPRLIESPEPRRAEEPSPTVDRAVNWFEETLTESAQVPNIARGMYSREEVLRTKEFSLLNAAEQREVGARLKSIRLSPRRRSRRLRPGKRPGRIDLRRSLRSALRTGGEMLELKRARPSTSRRRVVVLCDISGSMEAYTKLLLHFLCHVRRNDRRSEVFLFGTRLTRVTSLLDGRDSARTLASIGDSVRDWSGGTRIGEALREFNRLWSRRVLTHSPVVIVISDGWDLGAPRVLETEIRRLQRNTHRLIWLNPLLGSPGYRPATRGMESALPYVDAFLPAHNLQSLELLANTLAHLPSGRPNRRS